MKLTWPSTFENTRAFWMWPFLAVLSIAAGVLITIWPAAVTLITGIVIGLFILTQPMLGLIIVMLLLYFPIFPNLQIGGLETSITGPLFLLLAVIIIFQSRGNKLDSPLLATWQKALLAVLALVFSLVTILSQNTSISLPFIPNLAVYVIGLFVTMAMIDSKERLVLTGKVMLVLAFVRSIWGLELGPIRAVLGLSDLGANPSAFTFHPVFALSLVILIIPGAFFSRRWRIFAGFTLISLVVHGFLLETRAAWAVWSLVLLAFTIRLPLKNWSRFLPLIVMLFSLIGLFYLDTFQNNWQQTQRTLTSLGEGNTGMMSPGDHTRQVAHEAGLAMFREYPIMGWGPNMFIYLKPQFISENSSKARNPGAFNAWLKVLAEMGLVGVLISALAVILPLLQTWLCLRKVESQEQEELKWLAFGFSLGAFGLAIHLLFIDQLYSFYWVHVGLALAAARLVIEQKSTLV